MAKEVFALSKTDRDGLRRELDLLRAGRELPPGESRVIGSVKADDHYLAYAPEDSFIPAMEDDVQSYDRFD